MKKVSYTLGTEMVLISPRGGYDWDRDEEVWNGYSREYLTVAEAITKAEKDDFLSEYFCEDEQEAMKAGDISKIERFVDLWSTALSDSDYPCYFRSKAEDDAQQAEEQRLKLEQAAGAFSAECGHPVATREYVAALRRAIDRLDDRKDTWDSGECKMERWAAARYCGQSTEGFWSDEDYSQQVFGNQYRELEQVLEWLQANCPLLMASIRESELAKVGSEDEDE